MTKADECPFDGVVPAASPNALIAAVALMMLALTVTCTSAIAQTFGPYQVQELNVPPGYTAITLTAVNANGEVIGYCNAGALHEAFVWSSSNGMTFLGDLPGYDNSEAYGINNNGEITGRSGLSSSSNEAAFYWSPASGLKALSGEIGPSEANGININGEIVGTQNSQIFSWTNAGGMQGIAGFSNDVYETVGVGVNASGEILGDEVLQNLNYVPFVWSSTKGIQTIEQQPGSTYYPGFAKAINDSGVVLGDGDTPFAFHAFVWTSNGGVIDLGDLSDGTKNTYAGGINSAGDVVGRTVSPAGEAGFIWTSAGGMKNMNDFLDPSANGWIINEALGISDSGQIIGIGTDPSGVVHAILLSPVPEPPAALLGALALLTLLVGPKFLKRL